jgi:hypothetical protein
VTYRSPSTNEYYPTASDDTSQTIVSQSDNDYPQQDSYLTPTTTTKQRTIAGNMSNEVIPLINPPRTTDESNIPRVGIKGRAPLRPVPLPPSIKPNQGGDSYV